MARIMAEHKKLEISINADGKISEINYLKGFSILSIVLMHLLYRMKDLPSKIHTLASIGGTGVHVFFLCSGIGLYLSYLKRKMNYTEFLKKRYIKIYIPYIIVVFVSFLLPWMYSDNDRVAALFSHIFLFKMFVPRYECSFGGHFWFISTIIQLYLLFIPMCLIKEKMNNNKHYLGIFLSISVCWWFFCYIVGNANERIWCSFCLQYIWEFALGFVIADELAKGKIYKISNLFLLIVAVTGIGIQSGMAMTSGALKVLNDIPALLGYTSLAFLLMNVSLINKGATWLATMSYELFLVHVLVFQTIFYFVEPQGLLFQCIIGSGALIVAIVISFLYHLFSQIIITFVSRTPRGNTIHRVSVKPCAFKNEPGYVRL